MKVTDWYFVSATHKVMTALIVVMFVLVWLEGTHKGWLCSFLLQSHRYVRKLIYISRFMVFCSQFNPGYVIIVAWVLGFWPVVWACFWLLCSFLSFFLFWTPDTAGGSAFYPETWYTRFIPSASKTRFAIANAKAAAPTPNSSTELATAAAAASPTATAAASAFTSPPKKSTSATAAPAWAPVAAACWQPSNCRSVSLVSFQTLKLSLQAYDMVDLW